MWCSCSNYVHALRLGVLCAVAATTSAVLHCSCPQTHIQLCMSKPPVSTVGARTSGVPNLWMLMPLMRGCRRVQRRAGRIPETRPQAPGAEGTPFTRAELKVALRHCALDNALGCNNIPYLVLRVDTPLWQGAMLQYLELCRLYGGVPSMWETRACCSLCQVAKCFRSGCVLTDHICLHVLRKRWRELF